MMDYKALHALAAVVRCGGFEPAAKDLCVTQSAVSQRVKGLENRLGQPVLIRQTPPIATELGQKLISHLHRVEHLEKDLTLANPQVDRVHARIAINADSMATWFPEAIGKITDEMDVDIVIADQDKGIELMRRGEVLACLCSEDTAINGARVDRLGVVRYRAYASPDFLLRYKILDQPDKLHLAPCLQFNEDDKLQHQFLNMLGMPDPLNPIRCPSSEGFVQMAANGCGFGMIPEMQAAIGVASGSLIDLAPTSPIDIPLYWHTWRSGGSAMKRLRASVIKSAHRWLRQDR
ncbi:LysR family transcriptional regulator ArgP [Reinekea marina]|uniref:LysR family transcriptional regulator ArgP n=1 Tax=Reinekea marina TaxID=1310421 RepID=A0ABV7WNS1_9GAMM|nr:LysR family transcriptional regulator ArgP [Reinekea marina]MDN3648587.1 LysR family transcriptional regulator ArgP [Reinekea marina]